LPEFGPERITKRPLQALGTSFKKVQIKKAQPIEITP
jgi:hypothetical protein